VSIVTYFSRHRRLRIALITAAACSALLWSGYERLMSRWQSALDQGLAKRGMSLTYSNKSSSLWGGFTLHDAALCRLYPNNEPIAEISKLNVDIMWRESWNTRSAVTRWQADDPSLTLHDEGGAVILHHFTTDFVLQGTKIDIASLGTRNGPLAFDLTGQILITAASGAPTEKQFSLNLMPIRVALNTLELEPRSGLFTITGAFNLDLREASVIWSSKLHGTGKQVRWRGAPMKDADISATLSQNALALSPRINFARGSITAEFTRAGWQQQPLLMSGTLTDSGGRISKFNGRHKNETNTFTVASLSGNADLLELARNFSTLAGQLPSNVKITTFPAIAVKNFVWQAGRQPPAWSLDSLQLLSPAALAVMVRDHPLTIDSLTGRVSYEQRRWLLADLKGQLLGGQFALNASYDGKTLSKASISLRTLRLAKLSPWLGKISTDMDDADLSLDYSGVICNQPKNSTGSGILVLNHAPVINIPLLDQAYQLFPKLLPGMDRSGSGDIQASFSMTHGIATINPLKAHGESVTVTARGTVDLVNRRVAGHARANLRGLIGVATYPLGHILTNMEISGSLDDIRVSPQSPISAAKTIITIPAEVATGGVKLSSSILREGLSLPFEALGMFDDDTPKTAKP